MATVIVGLTTAAWSQNLCEQLSTTGLGIFAPKYPGASAEGECTDGIYTFTAKGHDFYWGWDRGGFAYYTIPNTGDFTFSAKIEEMPSFVPNTTKLGICVREGLYGNERTVQLRYDKFFTGKTDSAQIVWFYRYLPAGPESEFCSRDVRDNCFYEGGTGVKEPEGAVLKITRVDNLIELYVNGERVAEDQTLAMATETIYVGLIAAYGGGDNPIVQTAKFSELQCEGYCPNASGAKKIAASMTRNNKWRCRANGNVVRFSTIDGMAFPKFSTVLFINPQGKTLHAQRQSSTPESGISYQFDTPLAAGLYYAIFENNNGRQSIVAFTGNR